MFREGGHCPITGQPCGRRCDRMRSVQLKRTTTMGERRAPRWRQSALALCLCSTVALADHYTVPLFVPAATSNAAQGLLRILSDSDASGSVAVYAIDDAGTRSGPAMFTLGAHAVAEFDATDLTSGNAAKGLTGSLATGTGDWRLEIETELQIEPLALCARRRRHALGHARHRAPDDRLRVESIF